MSEMRSSAKNIKLSTFDDLFKSGSEIEQSSQERVQEIPLNQLHPFNNHPFQVRDDEEMQKLVESIQHNGVLIPAMARHLSDGGYELVSGHRRKHASELAGKETMPVIVREMDDDTATIIMVDANLQREELLPSERAFAYKMKLDAMKRQGKRTDLTCSQVGNKLAGRKSSDVLAEQVGESKNQIFRYIRLTELTSPLLQMVDDKKFSLNPAVEVSYLKQSEQEMLLEVIRMEDSLPSLAQAKQLKTFSQDGKLNENAILAIMTAGKESPVKVTLTGNKLKKYFPKEFTQMQMESVIFDLLEDWSKTHL